MKINCVICNLQYYTVSKFSKHLKHTHIVKLEDYYENYIEKRPVCAVCESPTVYLSYHKGYSKCCSSKKCSAINYRKIQKLDTVKHKIFSDKVSNNMKELWKLPQDERITKIKKTQLETISKMTADERKEKFGWLSKLSEEDKKKFIQDVMIQTGCHRWWKTADEEIRLATILKRTLTLIKTWEIQGVEIYNKQCATFQKNCEKGTIIISDEEYERTKLLLSKVFNL